MVASNHDHAAGSDFAFTLPERRRSSPGFGLTQRVSEAPLAQVAIPKRRHHVLMGPEPIARARSVAHHKTGAELILTVVRATAQWQRVNDDRAVVKPLRQLIWWVWEGPRLPRPRVRGKYPYALSWSRNARRAVRLDPAAPLIIDHVTPINLVIHHLLLRPPLQPAGLVRTLNEKLNYVILAPEDNRKLTRRRVGNKLAPTSTNPWDRYKDAGISIARVSPAARTSAATANHRPMTEPRRNVDRSLTRFEVRS